MTPSNLPQRSAFWLRWFLWYTRRFLRKNFHAVRLARGSRPVDPGQGPLIVVLNHPSWWDPLFGLVLTQLFPNRMSFVPIDALALAKYRFFAKLGAFGIEPGTLAGARQFLRVSRAICAHPNTALWITCQGKFTDPRQRPLAVQAARAISCDTSTAAPFCRSPWSIPFGTSVIPKPSLVSAIQSRSAQDPLDPYGNGPTCYAIDWPRPRMPWLRQPNCVHRSILRSL